jgi:hypothetical protein
MTLATETADALGVDPQARDELVGAALCVGQWLADAGRPGEWETVEAGEVLRAMAFSEPIETGTFLFALAALFGHAGLEELVSRPAARRILGEIAGLVGNEPVATFAANTAKMLRDREGEVSAWPDGPAEPHP